MIEEMCQGSYPHLQRLSAQLLYYTTRYGFKEETQKQTKWISSGCQQLTVSSRMWYCGMLSLLPGKWSC